MKENVFVDKDGVLRIGDFGLSRMVSDESLWLTSATQAGGTVRWMAPELFMTGAVKEWTSDVYAFGMTVLEVTVFTLFPSSSSHLISLLIDLEDYLTIVLVDLLV